MKKIISLISIIILMFLCVSTVFATNVIDTNVVDENLVDTNAFTKERLEQAIKKINNIDGMNGQFRLDDDEIIISAEGEEYSFTYNLEGKPTFTSKVTCTNDMTVEEFKSEFEKIILGGFGFIIISVDKGIEIEDALYYLLKNKYDFPSLEKVINEQKEGEFNSIDILSKQFDEEEIIKFDLYTIKIKNVSKTETEYVLEATYEINIEEDFSVLDGIYEDPLGDIVNKAQAAAKNYEIAANEESKKLEDLLQNLEKENSIISNVIEIPQTGKSFETLDFLWITLFISVGAFTVYTIYNRRVDGNK